jgi:hypothetical protein
MGDIGQISEAETKKVQDHQAGYNPMQIYEFLKKTTMIFLMQTGKLAK